MAMRVRPVAAARGIEVVDMTAQFQDALSAVERIRALPRGDELLMALQMVAIRRAHAYLVACLAERD